MVVGDPKNVSNMRGSYLGSPRFPIFSTPPLSDLAYTSFGIALLLAARFGITARYHDCGAGLSRTPSTYSPEKESWTRFRSRMTATIWLEKSTKNSLVGSVCVLETFLLTFAGERERERRGKYGSQSAAGSTRERNDAQEALADFRREIYVWSFVHIIYKKRTKMISTL